MFTKTDIKFYDELQHFMRAISHKKVIFFVTTLLLMPNICTTQFISTVIQYFFDAIFCLKKCNFRRKNFHNAKFKIIHGLILTVE